MTDVETLEERVRTVERAVTDGDHDFPAVDELTELTERIDAIEQRVEELDERTTELEAATQALRGYVGNVRSVNEQVEQRADTALAATERLERRLEAGDAESPGREPAAGPARATASSGVDTQSGRTLDSATAGTDESETEDHAGQSAGAGVLEQIRSLL